MLRMSLNVVFLAFAVYLAQFGQGYARGSFGMMRDACLAAPTYVCSLAPTEGSFVSGVIMFMPSWSRTLTVGFGCHVRIRANVSGLTPGKHGFHVHTYGDIRASDGTSTGGHFTNPQGIDVKHGFNSNIRRHWGDLNNLIAQRNGSARYNRVDRLVTLRSFLGRGVTIHAESDKGPLAQPTGGAGARVATCVIGYANPEVE